MKKLYQVTLSRFDGCEDNGYHETVFLVRADQKQYLQLKNLVDNFLWVDPRNGASILEAKELTVKYDNARDQIEAHTKLSEEYNANAKGKR